MFFLANCKTQMAYKNCSPNWFKLTVFLALLGMAGIAFAATGDEVAVVDLPVPVGPTLAGVSIAVDCSGTLYYTIFNAAVLLVTDKDGTSIALIDTVDASTNLQIILAEMAWDKGRGNLWAAAQIEKKRNIYLLDPVTGIATFQFTAPEAVGPQIIDGLAFDGTDDSIWLSPIASEHIWHYRATDGMFLGMITPTNSIGDVLSSNDGVVVGVGDLLYLGQFGLGEIVKVKKSEGSFISSFASPDNHYDGLECDVQSFAPKTVIWMRGNTALGPLGNLGTTARAIEVDAGTCTCGAVDPGHNGGGNGDPHFTTRLGGRFDYHGERVWSRSAPQLEF
jgi:hypothetical protein